MSIPVRIFSSSVPRCSIEHCRTSIVQLPAALHMSDRTRQLVRRDRGMNHHHLRRSKISATGARSRRDRSRYWADGGRPCEVRAIGPAAACGHPAAAHHRQHRDVPLRRPGCPPTPARRVARERGRSAARCSRWCAAGPLTMSWMGRAGSSAPGPRRALPACRQQGAATKLTVSPPGLRGAAPHPQETPFPGAISTRRRVGIQAAARLRKASRRRHGSTRSAATWPDDASAMRPTSMSRSRSSRLE